MDSCIQDLCRIPKGNELTYAQVMSCLSIRHAKPRDKLTQLLKKKVLIRVKKGLYILGDIFRKMPLSKEVLANLIYGPSYVSLEWALSFYGMIPERVETVTSITFKRNKNYQTPVGNFSYFYLDPKRYPSGIRLLEIAPYQSFLIATKEKALCDFLILRRGKITSHKTIEEILFEDLRIDEEEIQLLDTKAIEEINNCKHHSSLKYLIKAVEKLKS